MKWFLTFILFAGFTTSASAALLNFNYTFLTDPSLYQDLSPGPDLAYGTADDAAAPGLNPAGHVNYFTASYELDETEWTGYQGGTLSLTYDDQALSFTTTAVDTSGYVNCPPAFCGVPTPLPIAWSLANWPGPVPPASTNGGFINPDGTSSYEYDTLTDAGDTIRNTGMSWAIGPGVDFNNLPPSFTPEIVATLQYALTSPALPGDWVQLFFAIQDGVVLDGPNGPLNPLGTFAGLQSSIGYLTAADIAVVPLPAGLPLLLSGFVALPLLRRQCRMQT